jgi:hypothetical protein
MQNRNGDQVSAQISVAGKVDFSGGSFRKDTPFCLKNDGETAVTLEVTFGGCPKESL